MKLCENFIRNSSRCWWNFSVLNSSCVSWGRNSHMKNASLMTREQQADNATSATRRALPKIYRKKQHLKSDLENCVSFIAEKRCRFNLPFLLSMHIYLTSIFFQQCKQFRKGGDNIFGGSYQSHVWQRKMENLKNATLSNHNSP